MTGEATIRAAGPEDVHDIHRLLSALAAEIGDAEIFRTTEATLRRDGFGGRAHFEVLLAEIGGLPEALALFMPYYSTTMAMPGVYVQDLYLSPDARGRALGTRLLAAAMARGQDWGAGFLRLTVYRDNEPAIGFYRRLGFGFGHEDLAAGIEAEALLAAARSVEEQG
jgi:GNAT superfamily N-acetyltransferase